MKSSQSRHIAMRVFGAAAFFATLLVAACGSTSTGPVATVPSLTSCHVTATDLTVSTSTAAPTAPTANSALSGKKLVADGSSALQPLFQGVAKAFDAGLGTQSTVNAGGSGQGLKDVESGAVQIGDSDIFTQDSSTPDSFKDLVDHRVAVVAFTLVVSNDIKDTVQNLTQQQIIDIYTGVDNNWSQVGGPNEAITVINRPTTSGTRASFRKFVLNGATENSGTTLTTDSTGAVATAVSSGQGAIGYVTTGFVLNAATYPGINPICISGYAATSKDINSGNYKFWNFEHAYTKGTPDAVSQAFLDYAISSTVQTTLVPELNFFQVSQLSSAALATHPLPAGATK